VLQQTASPARSGKTVRLPRRASRLPCFANAHMIAEPHQTPFAATLTRLVLHPRAACRVAGRWWLYGIRDRMRHGLYAQRDCRRGQSTCNCTCSAPGRPAYDYAKNWARMPNSLRNRRFSPSFGWRLAESNDTYTGNIRNSGKYIPGRPPRSARRRKREQAALGSNRMPYWRELAVRRLRKGVDVVADPDVVVPLVAVTRPGAQTLRNCQHNFYCFPPAVIAGH
jgi:hypothetical protein